MSLRIAIVFFGFWLALQFLLRSQPFHDPGALWHVRVGDWIFQHSAFPQSDPFTWSHTGHAWIPQQWAAECLMSLGHRLGGYDTLLTLMNALLAGMATWIVERFLRGGLHWLPALALTAFGMVVAGFHFYLRPHLFTMLFMVVVMVWIVDFDRERISQRRWIWFIPLCILWTNLHGGVLGGIATLGLAAVLWTFHAAHRRAVPLLLVIVALAAAGTLVNPFGIDMHRTWLSIVGSPELKELVDEHMPLSLSRTEGQAVAGFGVFYVVMLMGTFPKSPRIPWLIPLVWLVLSISSIRHGPLFCLTALVVIADFFPETIWYRLLKKYGDTFVAEPPVPADKRSWILPTLILGVAILFQTLRMRVPVIGHGWMRFDNKYVPIELIDEVRTYAANRPEGFPIFNDANLGGFLIYHAPRLRIYMDDRCELYGGAGLRRYAELMGDHPERIEELADRIGFDRAFITPESDMEKYLLNAPQWREVARSRRAVLFARHRGE